MEIWKPVFGYESWYSVSNFGRIRRDRKGARTYIGRIIQASKTIKNVNLSKYGQDNYKPIYFVVAEHFIGKRPKGYVINHKDGNRTNNHVDNLEYVTQRDNILHSWHVLGNHTFPVGEMSHAAKLNNRKVKEIRYKYSIGNTTHRKLAKEYGVDHSTIGFVLRNKYWKHVISS